jgi:FKBP-type peptidyl-prolyl cis-trans isomerase FkpA
VVILYSLTFLKHARKNASLNEVRLSFFFLITVVTTLVAPLAVLSAQTASQTTSTSTAAKKPATASRSTATHPPARRAAAPAAVALTTDDQKTAYAAGLFIYKRFLAPLNLSPEEFAIVQRAILDQAKGKPAEDLDAWGPKLDAFAQKRAQAANDGVVQKALAEPGAVKTDSGIIYRQLSPGTGESPKPTDTVKVQYRGTLADGSEFDSSSKRNAPAEFPLDHVIKCWTEGVQKMKVGEKAQLVCPANLAYGDHPPQGIPPNANLTFQIELLGITTPAK